MADVDYLANFLKLTGYRKEDIWGYNRTTRVVVTSNGGKYVVSLKGTTVRRILGPETPKAQARRAAEEEESEE